MEYQPILIQAETLGEAWEKTVKEVMKNGFERFIKAPDYSCYQKDMPVFISVKTPLKEPRIHPKAPVQKGQAEEYSKNVIFGMEDKEKENAFDYTYFGRFRCYPDCDVRANWPNVTKEEEVGNIAEKLSGGKCIARVIDQVQLAIDTLKKDPSRRSVVLISWIPSRDSIKFGPKREKTSSPCIVYIHPQIIEGKLHLFVVMKTNDLFNAFPLNAFALTELQKHMAEKIGVGVGSYNHFAVSMNIYEDVYEQIKSIFEV
ncbi:MAG: thymidylate synthase [Candidatus Aenigmatarchaeota archaeon]